MYSAIALFQFASLTLVDTLLPPRLGAAVVNIHADRICSSAKVLQAHCYEDRPLAIGVEQTISQPSTVAIMLEALACEPGHRILDIGSG